MDNDCFHPVIFESITTEPVWIAALHTQGAAEPSELDVA